MVPGLSKMYQTTSEAAISQELYYVWWDWPIIMGI